MWLIAAIVVTYRRKRQRKSGISYSKMQAGILPSTGSLMVRCNIDEIARRSLSFSIAGSCNHNKKRARRIAAGAFLRVKPGSG
jgi:hypothetical protein